MDPNQQPPQYPPQFFYPVPGTENQQHVVYPPQGMMPQPMMMQPGMVPQFMPQQHQPGMMAPTTGYVIQPHGAPVVQMQPTMVTPAPIHQTTVYMHTPTPDDVGLLETGTPMLTDRSIKERLFDREYTVDIGAWFSESWEIYKKNYAVFILWTLILIGLGFIPYVGILASVFLSYSFIAGINDTLRPSRVVINFKNFTHLFMGCKYALHMFVLHLLVGLIVLAGLIALVVPGLYFQIVLAFTIPVYLEYRSLGLKLTESIWVSGKVLHKRFCGILGYLIVCVLIITAGALLLGVGLLVAVPLVYISMSVAFREIFAFRENHLYAAANLEQQI